MFDDETPDPEQVVADLSDLVPLIYGSLEVGAAKAHRWFEMEQSDPEVYLFNDMVRHSARRHLVEKGRLSVDFEYDELANNGLRLWYRGWDLRLRKAYRRGVHPAGSFAMQAFHAQTMGLFPGQPASNLFVLWDLLRPSFALAPDLYVACPKAGRMKFPDVAECHWLMKLPNVALMPQTAVRIDDAAFEDLPIHRPIEQAGTE